MPPATDLIIHNNLITKITSLADLSCLIMWDSYSDCVLIHSHIEPDHLFDLMGSISNIIVRFPTENTNMLGLKQLFN